MTKLARPSVAHLTKQNFVDRDQPCIPFSSLTAFWFSLLTVVSEMQWAIPWWLAPIIP